MTAMLKLGARREMRCPVWFGRVNKLRGGGKSSFQSNFCNRKRAKTKIAGRVKRGGFQFWCPLDGTVTRHKSW